MVRVETFVMPGCARCSAGLDALKAIAESFGTGVVAWKERNLLENIDYAVDLGILASPAMAIDGKLAFTSLPGPQQFRAELIRHMGA